MPLLEEKGEVRRALLPLKDCSGPGCSNSMSIDGLGTARRQGLLFFCSEECERRFDAEKVSDHPGQGNLAL